MDWNIIADNGGWVPTGVEKAHFVKNTDGSAGSVEGVGDGWVGASLPEIEAGTDDIPGADESIDINLFVGEEFTFTLSEIVHKDVVRASALCLMLLPTYATLGSW